MKEHGQDWHAATLTLADFGVTLLLRLLAVPVSCARCAEPTTLVDRGGVCAECACYLERAAWLHERARRA